MTATADLRGEAGTVVWITGLAGAGKSALGRALRALLQAHGRQALMLDGDEMRAVFEAEAAHEASQRHALARRYAALCRLVSSQGIDVLCCTISLFHDVHAWNRAHLPRYFEVLLDVPAGVLEGRNQKGLHDAAAAGAPVVGRTLQAQFPLSPDLRLHYREDRSPESLAALVAEAAGLLRMPG